MIFRETELAGACLIEIEPRVDERGFFARTWCRREFEAHGIEASLAQCNVSFSTRRGTLRGMHCLRPPHEEAKLIRCTRGAIYDVIIDVRPDSATFGRHVGVRLDAENSLALFVPKGFAHGFQTLEDATEVLYQMSEFYTPEAIDAGLRWDDPALGIEWPLPNPILNERDRSYPDFAERFPRHVQRPPAQ